MLLLKREKGARDSGNAHCTECLCQEPLYISIYVLKKVEKLTLRGAGGGRGSVLNICISEVALIFIGSAGLCEGGVEMAQHFNAFKSFLGLERLLYSMSVIQI